MTMRHHDPIDTISPLKGAHGTPKAGSIRWECISTCHVSKFIPFFGGLFSIWGFSMNTLMRYSEDRWCFVFRHPRTGNFPLVGSSHPRPLRKLHRPHGCCLMRKRHRNACRWAGADGWGVTNGYHPYGLMVYNLFIHVYTCFYHPQNW